MANTTLNVGPYVDLGYVEGGYLSDAFFIEAQEASLRGTDGLLTEPAAFTLTGIAATTKASLRLQAAVSTFSLVLKDADDVKASLHQRAHVTPFSVSAFDAVTKSARTMQAGEVAFFLRGIPIRFGAYIPPFIDAIGPTSDISDQSKDYENLRLSYGGSDNSSPSFQRPQYVRWNSISKSKDFGDVDTLDAQIRGRLGQEAGTRTLYFKATLQFPSKISLTRLAGGNKYDNAQVSLGILDAERKPIPIDNAGYASPPQTDDDRLLTSNAGTQQNLQFLPAGTYYFTVTSHQWRACDFGIRIFVGGTADLSGTAALELAPVARVAQSYLSGSAALTDQSFGNIRETWEIAGTAEGRLDPTLGLTRTSPYSTT